MARYINRTPEEFIDEVLIVADIGGEDTAAAPAVERDVDMYINAHPEFVNYVLRNGDSLPLHVARMYHYFGTAKYLLERGAKVNYVNPKTGESILTYALRRDVYAPPEFIQYLRNHPTLRAMESARAAKGFLELGRAGLGPRSTPDTETVILSFLTGEEGSIKQQTDKLKAKATAGRRKTKKNKKQKKRRKTRK